MMTNDVLFEELKGKKGNIGLITLNRPQALNALTQTMCLSIEAQLKVWATAPEIKAVIVKGEGDKAFCAGGDIRHLYDLGKQGRQAEAMTFFKDEYRLNYLISNYPKPYIAFMDGITMGGGMGLSIHGNVRIGTERLMMAMPETGIGFFPDIGGTYFLSRCPDEIGIYLGLTGARMNAVDALYVHLLDFVVPSYHLSDLLSALQNDALTQDSIMDLVKTFSISPELSPLFSLQDFIAEAFSQESVEAIIDKLKSHEHSWHQTTLKDLAKKSPTSLKVSLAALRKGITQNLETCLNMEYNLCHAFLQSHDFYEGVRALLVDKDKNPQWQPATLEEVTEEQVQQYFVAEE